MNFEADFANASINKIDLYRNFSELIKTDQDKYEKILTSLLKSTDKQTIYYVSEYIYFNFHLHLLSFEQIDLICKDISQNNEQFQVFQIQKLLAVCRQINIFELKPCKVVQLLVNDYFAYLKILQSIYQFMQTQTYYPTLELIILLDANIPVPQTYLQPCQDQYAQYVQDAYLYLKNKKQAEQLQASSALKQFAQIIEQPNSQNLCFGFATLMKVLQIVQKDAYKPSKSSPQALKQLCDSHVQSFFPLLILDAIIPHRDYKENVLFALLARDQEIPKPKNVIEKILSMRIRVKIAVATAFEGESICEENITKAVDTALALAHQPNLELLVYAREQMCLIILQGLNGCQQLKIKDKVFELIDAVRAIQLPNNSVQFILASILALQFIVFQYISGDTVIIQNALSFQSIAKQKIYLNQTLVDELIIQLSEFSQFTPYTVDLGKEVFKSSVRQSAMINLQPVIEGVQNIQIVEPPQKSAALQQQLSDTEQKFNKLLGQYNLLQKKVGIQMQQPGVMQTGEDDTKVQELKKENNNMTLQIVTLDSKIENLSRMNQQLSDDKKRLQDQLEIANRTSSVMQEQLQQQQLRMEELQNKKINAENQSKEQQKMIEELKTSNQNIGENYRSLKTAIAQVRSIVNGVEVK